MYPLSHALLTLVCQYTSHHSGKLLMMDFALEGVQANKYYTDIIIILNN